MIVCSRCAGVSPYCDGCVAATFEQLGGVAMSRGMTWAMSVAARRPHATDPWPPFEGRCAELARRKVAGITSDGRLSELLAKACWADAARWWGRR